MKRVRRGTLVLLGAPLAALAGAVALAAIFITPAIMGNGRDGEISRDELARLPSIVLVWAERQRAKSSTSGDLYVARADAASVRRIKTWELLGSAGNGDAYGVYGASWSPGRQWIALVLSVWNSDPDGQIALIRANGRGLRTLGTSSWTAGHPNWSPSGRILAFTVLGGVWIHSPANRTTKRIWQARGHNTVEGIAWSPDGRRLAVAEDGAGIATMSPSGKDVRRLTYGDDADPQWSPDGRRIVFERYGSQAAVWVVDVGGGKPRRLTLGGSASWSPDGRSVLFMRTRETMDEYGFVDSFEDVYVIGAGGQRLRRLTLDEASYPVAWSPDGSKILFARETREEKAPDKPWSELWVMDADGGRPTRLAFNRFGQSVLSADWRS